jgi:hypothetical protein
MNERTKQCPVDSGKMVPLFSARVLGKYDVQYFICKECSLIQSQEPYWLDEAYDRALAVCDTGIMERNLHNAVRASAVIRLLAGKKADVVDVAGGYGILTRLLRDIGFNCVWNDKYCENLLAPGFERPAGFVADIACAFEVFEHIVDPSAFFDEIVAQHGGRFVLFSTESFTRIPDQSWIYYAFNTGQHITFYSRESLSQLARRAGWIYYALPRHLHLFAKMPVARWKRVLLQTPLIYLMGAFSILLMRGQSKTQSDSAASAHL